jgi:hypothetical protein
MCRRQAGRHRPCVVSKASSQSGCSTSTGSIHSPVVEAPCTTNISCALNIFEASAGMHARTAPWIKHTRGPLRVLITTHSVLTAETTPCATHTETADTRPHSASPYCLASVLGFVCKDVRYNHNSLSLLRRWTLLPGGKQTPGIQPRRAVRTSNARAATHRTPSDTAQLSNTRGREPLTGDTQTKTRLRARLLLSPGVQDCCKVPRKEAQWSPE